MPVPAILWLAKVLAACGHAARNGLFRLPGNSAQTAVLRLNQGGEGLFFSPGAKLAFWNNGHAYRHQGQPGYFEMLQAKWNANDGKAAEQA